MIFTNHTIRYIFLFFTLPIFLSSYADYDPFGDLATMEKYMGGCDKHVAGDGQSSRGIFDTVENLEDSMSLDTEDFFAMVSLDDVANRAITLDGILELLNDMGAFSILDVDFYKRTNPFAKRNVLDLHVWELHGCREPERWIVGVNFFWNHMDRSVFTCKSTNIDSYINFDQTTLFEKLNELSPELKAAFPEVSLIDTLLDQTNVDNLLALFRTFTVQQRRVGAMLHAWRQWQRFELRMLLPIYYIERNIFTGPAEQTALEAQFGALDPDSQEKFEKNHAVSDKLGLGDFRLEVDYAAYKTDDFTLRVGAFTTIPTAVAFKTGIKGSSFLDANKTQPTFDLQALFNIIPEDFDFSSMTDAEIQQVKDIVIGDICKNKNGFFLGVLDRLNAMLIDTKLGNDQHIGLGFMLRSRTLLSSFLYQFEWAKRFSFNNRISLEYLVPANETRFFAYRNKASDFSSRDFESSDPAVQEANLTFIETELVNKFYPYAVKTKVQPGVIFRWVSRYCYCGEIWDITAGSDFWLQTQEKFNSFCTSVNLDRLDIEHGHVPFAYQEKLFASFALKWQSPTYLWLLGLNAEGTILNKGIGEDWTVSLNIEVNF